MPSRRKRHGVKPLLQGDLDYLCGFYAIINAIRVAGSGRPLSADDCERLFLHMMHDAAAKKTLTPMLLGGTSQSELLSLLKSAREWTLIS